jgi:tetraacyldisaccharide 4'-kinase
MPEKFFSPLRGAGATLIAARPFADHHAYTARELSELLREARDRQAILVTTPKDAVRLPHAIRSEVMVVGVRLSWREPERIDQLLDRVIGMQATS